MDSDNTKLLQQIHKINIEMNDKIADIKIEMMNVKDLEKRVNTLEERDKWTIRAVVGAVIAAVMSLVLV